jgi:hypothetical protein
VPFILPRIDHAYHHVPANSFDPAGGLSPAGIQNGSLSLAGVQNGSLSLANNDSFNGSYSLAAAQNGGLSLANNHSGLTFGAGQTVVGLANNAADLFPRPPQLLQGHLGSVGTSVAHAHTQQNGQLYEEESDEEKVGCEVVLECKEDSEETSADPLHTGERVPSGQPWPQYQHKIKSKRRRRAAQGSKVRSIRRHRIPVPDIRLMLS